MYNLGMILMPIKVVLETPRRNLSEQVKTLKAEARIYKLVCRNQGSRLSIDQKEKYGSLSKEDALRLLKATRKKIREVKRAHAIAVGNTWRDFIQKEEMIQTEKLGPYLTGIIKGYDEYINGPDENNRR